MTSEMVSTTLTSGQGIYICDTGYRPESGSGFSFCTKYEGWTRPSLICIGIDCGHPPALDHRNVTSMTMTLYPAAVEYTCDPGYNRTDGNGSSSCQANGTWTEPSFKCQAVDCGIPNDIDHMDKGEVKDTIYMNHVTFSCSPGFTSPIKDATVECLADGTWSNPTLVCIRKDCGRPPPKKLMEVNADSTLFESEGIYTCAVGFKAGSGSGTSQCRDDETWTEPTLVCEQIDCDHPPALDHKNVTSVISTIYLALAEYACDTGYSVSKGDGVSSCQSDGTWSVPSLECQIIDCGNPSSSGTSDVSFVNTTYGSTAVYQECGLGYYLNGDGTSVCQADGKWSDSCQDIPNLRGTKTLPASSVSALECRTVVSDRCESDEILTGCSAKYETSGLEMQGSYIWSASCHTQYVTGSQAVARCCKIPGLQCEYIKSYGTPPLSCYKNFQLLDCACWTHVGRCPLLMTNNTCEDPSSYNVLRYAVCCSNDQLSCYVKRVSGEDSDGSGELTTTCGPDETMTACSGYNTDFVIQKAEIEERGGVDNCVVDPGIGRNKELHLKDVKFEKLISRSASRSIELFKWLGQDNAIVPNTIHLNSRFTIRDCGNSPCNTCFDLGCKQHKY